MGEEKVVGMIRCLGCGWNGPAKSAKEVEGEAKASDGFLIWLDMRRNRRRDLLCPSCGRILSEVFDLMGYRDTVLR